jgi:pyridinium-3,5-bisthiocarboxylic acid mononucleotide nickel chelatase
MRLAYFDCFAGASGDMILGALLDAGLDRPALVARLERLKLPDWTLDVRAVSKNGLAATAVNVTHTEPGAHRTLADITALIAASGLPDAEQTMALRIFRRLAEAEARVHGSTPAEVHFHEVGAVDAIVDIVGAACALSLLGVQAVQASPLPLGRGFTRSAHGILPLPAPAVVELLRGVPLAATTATGETVTPTGAAILVGVATGFGPIPAMRLERIGYGAGSRDADYPNVLRVLIGETDASPNREALVELATNIDDLNPQLYEHVCARLFAAGALDVWLLPAQMKKGRPGSVFSVLCRPEHEAALSDIIFRETTTLGLRRQMVERRSLARAVRLVTTRFGQARVKLAILEGAVLRAMPEYEDCRQLAERSGAPLREIMAAVEQAALGQEPDNPGAPDDESQAPAA